MDRYEVWLTFKLMRNTEKYTAKTNTFNKNSNLYMVTRNYITIIIIITIILIIIITIEEEEQKKSK